MGYTGDKLVLVLYGSEHAELPPEDRFAEWWQFNQSAADDFGLRLTHAYGGFAEEAGLVDYKAYSIRRSRKRIEHAIAAGMVRSLEFLSMQSMPDGYISSDWDFASALSGAEPKLEHPGYMMVGIDIGWLSSIDALIGFRKFGLRHLSVRYGFATIMPCSYMPGGYVIGLASGCLPEDLFADANAWMHFADRQCAYRLRNVFAYNVLADRHLEIDISGQRLGDWIQAAHYRGSLASLGDGLWLWQIADGEELSMEALRWDAPAVRRVREELAAVYRFPWQEFAQWNAAPVGPPPWLTPRT